MPHANKQNEGISASLAERLEEATDRLQWNGGFGDRREREDCDLVDGELEHLLPVMRMLDQLSTSISESTSRSSAAHDFSFDATGTQLGDFRIVSELGRGGMGVVYEAEQVSLGRRVALKVLPFASMLDERQRRRFENKARAAASLEHPNIVPVYAVGCERDVHYYAMRLIEGKSLAGFMRQKCVRCVQQCQFNSRDLFCSQSQRATDGESEHGAGWECNGADIESPFATSRPYVRTVVEIAAQAADGLDHAHALGVIHRDVKPSNLLVTEDGHLWLTDFGLAQTTTQQPLTLTGDMVGTMRYMSPEQADARPVVDFRTDIYSLGVTLFELLALRPAFAAENPQQLLKEVTCCRVSPPSNINLAVPKELDNIVLKAVAENPDERYSSAHAMAIDLRRFLDGKPVLAKPPTWIDCTRKMMRRHAGVVWSILFGLTVAVFILAAGVVLIARERAAAQRAAVEAQGSAQLARHNQAETEREYHRAEANFRDARAAVDRMFLHADQHLAEFPNSDQIRHDLLEDSLQFYLKILNQRPTDDSATYDLAVAFDRVCDINHRLGNTEEARAACISAQELFNELVRADGADPRYQLGLAKSFEDLADIDLGLTGQREHAETLLQRQVEIVAKLVSEAPDESDYQRRLAQALTAHASVLANMGRLAAAEANYQRAVAIWEAVDGAAQEPSYVLGRATTVRGWGQLRARTHAFPQAKVHLTRAVSMLRQSPAREQIQIKHELAYAEQPLAKVVYQLGDVTQAEGGLASAIAIRRELVEAFPNAIDFQYQLAACHFDLYRVLSVTDRRAAHEALLASTQLLEQIVGETGGEMQHRIELARNYCEVGMWFQAEGEIETAHDYSRRSSQLRERCLTQFPLASDSYASLAWYLSMCPMLDLRDSTRAVDLARHALTCEPDNGSHWQVLGAALYRDGQWNASITALERAIELKKCADGFDGFLLACAHARAGDVASANQWFNTAQRWAEAHRWEAPPLQPLLAEATALLETPSTSQ